MSDITSTDVDALIAEEIRKQRAAGRESSTTTPPANTDPLTEHEQRLEVAEATLAAKTKRERLTLLARTALEEEERLDPDPRRRAEMIAALSDTEAIEYAGLAEPEPPNPNAYVTAPQTEQELAAAEILKVWHQKSTSQLREMAAEAGLDYAALAAKKAADPSTNIWGS